MQFACRLVIAWSAAAAVLVAAGCGDGDDGSTSRSGAVDEAGTVGGMDTPSSNRSDSAAKDAADPLHPVVRIETSLGNIIVKLDAEKAEMTVDKFLAYVESRHYDNTIFHQVLKDYVVLGGGYTPELVKKETSGTIFNEADNGLKNVRGTIAMARQPDGIDSATGQFFFNLSDNPILDHKSRETPEEYGYCVFGHVIEGMDVLDRIGGVEVTDIGEFEQTPVEKVLIKSIRRLR